MSSNLITINSPEEFREVLSRDLNKVSVLDFWATWAQPCEKMNQVVKEASEKYKNVLFLMVRLEITCIVDFQVLDLHDMAGVVFRLRLMYRMILPTRLTLRKYQRF